MSKMIVRSVPDRPLEVVGWLGTSGHQTIVNKDAKNTAAQPTRTPRTRETKTVVSKPQRG